MIPGPYFVFLMIRSNRLIFDDLPDVLLREKSRQFVESKKLFESEGSSVAGENWKLCPGSYCFNEYNRPIYDDFPDVYFKKRK